MANTSLRVAMLAPISWRVPPRHYGPWEQFVSLLTEGLVARGVDVTLFAAADSLTSATLVGTIPTGYSEDPELDAKVWEALHIATVFERAAEFDLIHNNFDFLPLTYSGLVETPVVTTIHGFSSEKIVPVFERYDDRGHYVAISDADRHPRLHYEATIHHGIRMDTFPLVETTGDYLLFFGRIHPHKGAVEAIDVAARVGLPLVIAGIVQDREYFERAVEPRIDGDRVRYIGSVGPDERGAVLGGARALLHLISFEEPFGFSVDRVHGVRHAGDRDAAWVHARAGAARRERRARGDAGRRGRRDRDGERAGSSRGARIGRAAVRRRPHGRRVHRGLPPDRRSGSRPWALTDRARGSGSGINYWPSRTAMRWWSAFDPAEVEADFARIAAGGFDSVRCFLSGRCSSRSRTAWTPPCSNGWCRWPTRRSAPD